MASMTTLAASSIHWTERHRMRPNHLANLDNVMSIRAAYLGRHIGFLLPHQEAPLAAALSHAFDLHQQ